MMGLQTARAIALAALLSGALLAAPSASAPSTDLAHSPSSYLQHHATDAVEWRQWNEDSLAEAKRAQRPIFLSIGYLACHWCHVMQRESFTDTETAELLNTRFIPILVDRQAQPDIDQLFQKLATGLGIRNGWPLNMVLTPDGHPFFGGVYFPPEPRAGVPSFRDVLIEAEALFAADPDGVAAYGREAIAQISEAARPAVEQGQLSRSALRAAIAELATEIDDFNGGFGDGVKFPRFPALMALWRGSLRSGDAELAEAVTFAMRAMINGAIFDHVGGGMFRYTVDPLWHQPHFEKMLDVNAMAIDAMTEIWRETRDPAIARVVAANIGFLLSELRLPGGAFAAALSAVSDGADGAYYVWQEEQIRAVLGDDYPIFDDAFDLALQEDTVKGLAIYRSEVTPEEIAEAHGLAAEQVQLRLDSLLQNLQTERATRAKPARDGKIIASWNGLAVSALVNAGMAFGRSDWVRAGQEAFQSTLDAVSSEGALYRSAYDGRVGGNATLEDRAFLARAAIDLHMAEGDQALLETARSLLTPIHDFEDQTSGGYFMTAQPVAANLPRVRTAEDTAAPSGNAVLGRVFASLYYLTGDSELRDKAERLISGFSETVAARPLDAAGMITTADELNDAVQVVIVADRQDANLSALLAAVWGVATPGRIVQVIAPKAELRDGHPAQYKGRVDDQATAYVCVGQICSLPNTDADTLAATIKDLRKTWR